MNNTYDNEKEMYELKERIDAIYNMAFKTYMLALFGKQLKLEETSKNELAAAFILEKQLKDISSSIGVDIQTEFESDRLDNEHKKACDILEYIINAYTGIVDEIKDNIQKNTDNSVISSNNVSIIYESKIEDHSINRQENSRNSIEKPKDNNIKLKEHNNNEESIQFTDNNEDIAALMNMFGV